MATFYFNGAVDGDWQTLGNWWMNSGHTVAATDLPTSSDSVIVTAGITGGYNPTPPSVVDLTLNDPAYLATTVRVTGTATLNGVSHISSSGGYLIVGLGGTATFNDDSYNGADVGGSGTAIFNDNSYNYAYLFINATFNDNSSNRDTAYNATFNDTSYNTGTIYGDATFNGDARNRGTVGGNATFTGNSYNASAVNGSATFNDASRNVDMEFFGVPGIVYGVARFNRYTAVGGAVTDTDAIQTGYVTGGIQDSQGNPVTLWRVPYNLNMGRIVCDVEFIGAGGCYAGYCDGAVTFSGESHCNDIGCTAVPVFRGQSTCAYSPWLGRIAVNNNGQGAYFEESSMIGRFGEYSGAMPRNRTTYPIQRGINGSSILGVI